MRLVNKYSLVEPERETQYAVLARDGSAIDVEIAGVIIEAQFELSDESGLIWLTDDSPYDEGLHIYLLNRNDTIEDALEAGAIFGMGGPGILKIITTGDYWVEFRFFLNDTIYRLEVAQQATLQLTLPTGWRYKKLLSRHRLTVREVLKGGE